MVLLCFVYHNEVVGPDNIGNFFPQPTLSSDVFLIFKNAPFVFKSKSVFSFPISISLIGLINCEMKTR